MVSNKEDIIMKRAMTVFAEQAVAYFGEPKKVKDIAQTEQVILDMKDMRMDYVFLMEDDTYTHFEFQSTDKGILDLVRFKLSKDYPMSKKADVPAMLYTFAHKFLSGTELENVKEVMKMTELGKMLHDEGVQEGIQKGIEEGKEDMVKELLKEGLLSKEQIAKAAKLPLEKIETIEKSIAALH